MISYYAGRLCSTVRVRELAGAPCCFLGQDTTPKVHHRNINGYRRLVGGNLIECWGVTYNGAASHPGGVAIYLAASYRRNRS